MVMRVSLVLALDPSQPSDASSHLFEELMDHDMDIILNRRNCMAATLQVIKENFPEVRHFAQCWYYMGWNT